MNQVYNFKPFNYDQVKELKLDSWLDQNLGIEMFTPGFERVRENFFSIVQRVNETGVKIITISGTNGKGQVAHSVSNQLTKLGFSVSLWTSPHILSVRERFVYFDKLVDPDILLNFFLISHRELSSKQYSYYEFLFYVFLKIFLKNPTDVIVLEVGLGGRLDTVNLIDANITGLVSISRDHQEYLGKTYREIMIEKLGITRKNVPLICSLELSYLRKILSKHAADIGYEYFDLFEERILEKDDDYSFRNTTLAKLLVQVFLDNLKTAKDEISRKEMIENYQSIEHSRFQIGMIKGREIEFIGAHNTDGIRKMVNILSKKGRSGADLLIAFSKRDKRDIITCLKTVLQSSVFKRVMLTEYSHNKCQPISELKGFLDLNFINENSSGTIVDDKEVLILKDFKSFFEKEVDESKGKVVVAGSYYFISCFQKEMLRRGCIEK